MRSNKHRFLLSLLLAAAAAGAMAAPQSSPNKAQPTQQQQRDEERDRQRRQKEQDKERKNSPYAKWANEDALYLLTGEEREAFMRFGTDEEREQFIEQIWILRDPTPDTVENEFKEEHYRRIAYANERFSSGVPGWRTDRGRIYIIWGPPDQIESHPGGSYVRSHDEGGGQTSTVPFERWRYRHMQGVGEDVVLEFVDSSGSGEYRLEFDPSKKDALLHVPNAGNLECENDGRCTRGDRLRDPFGTELAGKNIFDALEKYVKVQQPPPQNVVRSEFVSSRLVHPLEFEHRFDFLRVTGDTVLVPITLQIPNSQMSFQSKEGVHSAQLNVFARVVTLTGRRVQLFEDSITRDIPASLLQATLKGHAVYQKALPLRPGLYRLDIVVKDVNSGNVGVLTERLTVPLFEEQKLATSTLILADLIERVPAGKAGLGSFVIGAMKVRPRVDSTFTAAEEMGVFLQVYNLATDPKTGEHAASVEYCVLRGKEEMVKETEVDAAIRAAGQQYTIQKKLALDRLTPGGYSLEVRVTDNLTLQSVVSSALFRVKPAEKFTK